MSLFGSLFSAVSGLTAQSQAMGMISDNVSNVNTVSYKAAEAQFSTLVTRSAASSAYSPGGAKASTLYRIDQQGLVQASNSPTDIAIDGNGFFVVNSEIDAGGEQLYTRAGSFEQDFLGNLVNGAGFFLQGWALDSDEQVINVNQLGTVNVRVINGIAAATTNVELGANLDAGQAAFAGAYAAGDMAAYQASAGVSGVQPHLVRAVQVYDPLGGAHNLQLAFLKDPTANVWNVEIYADAAEVEAGDHPDGLLASGTVTFNGDGTLAATDITPTYPAATAGAPIGINWLDTDGQDDSTVTFDLGTVGQRRRPQPVRQRLQRRLRAAERRRGRRAERRQHGPGRLRHRHLHQWRDPQDLQAAARDLRQSAGARSADRQRLRPDCGIGRVQSARRRCRRRRHASCRRRWSRPMSIWPTSSPK